MKQFTVLILILISVVTTFAEELAQVELPPEVATSVNEIGKTCGQELAKSFLSLDEDGDGRVPLRTALSILMKRGFARPGGEVPESYKKNGDADRYRRVNADTDKQLIKLIKKDQAGMIGVDEIVAAFQTILTKSVGKQSSLDLDQDGKLTLDEYIVSVPTGDAQIIDKEEQKEKFYKRDVNEDGFLTGEEWITGQTPDLQDWVSAVGLTILIDKLDTDGDAILSEEELKTVLPDIESFPSNIALSESRHWLRELPGEQRNLIYEKFLPATILTNTSTIRWSPMIAAWYGQKIVARYRAALFNKTLVVEASYTDGWRSYSMDNLERAEAAFEASAISERPTQIILDKSLIPQEKWRQTKPKDMSKPDMEWYTWGFREKAFFTLQLAEVPEAEFQIKINAQICNDSSCALANDIQLNISNQPNTQESPVSETVEVLSPKNSQVVKN